MNKYKLLSVTLILLLLVGCSTKVERVSVDERIDLSGRWNDIDAMEVATEMIKDSLMSPWRDTFSQAAGRNPVVIVGNIKNKTDEQINSGVFIKHLERQLINSGRVTFVASKDERIELREERDDQQQGNTNPETMAALGREKGADFMLIGTVSSIIDEVKNKSAYFYQVNLELIDLETNEKIWIGEKQLKKSIKRSRYSL